MSQSQERPLKQRFLAFIKSPAFIVFIVCLLLMSYNLVHTYKLRPFNSDDVFWQTILQSWHPFSGSTVTLGDSSVYVDKLPYYAFFNHFFHPARRVIFMEAAVAGLAGFSMFYWSSLYFLKKLGARLNYLTLLPFLWLTSLGYAFASLYLNPNWRGFQIGLSFAAFAAVAALWWGDIRLRSVWSKLVLLILSAYAGLQIYSDPYFLYFTIGPIFILGAALLAVRRLKPRQVYPMAAAILLSLLFSKLFAHLAMDAGIRTAMDLKMQFIQFNDFGNSFSASIHSLMIIFNADFFGMNLNAVAVALLLNFVLLGYVLYKACGWLARGVRLDWQKAPLVVVWPVFFAVLGLLVFITQTISTLGQGTATYRYFLMLGLGLVILFALSISAMSNKSHKSWLGALLVVAILANLACTAFGKEDTHRFEVADNRANSLNYLIIDMLHSRGYDKGYANYWDASISTYFADSKVSFLPSVCVGPQAKKWHWLINDNAFDKPASRTFLWIDPDVPAACTPQNMVRQFGKPQSQLRVGDKIIFLYDYDITPKLPVTQS